MSFLLINKTLRLNNLKTWTAMNAKMPVFVIFVDVIIYVLLNNLHDCTFNGKLYFSCISTITNIKCVMFNNFIFNRLKKICLRHTFVCSHHGVVTKAMFGFKNIKNMLRPWWKWRKLKRDSMYKICENMGYHWPVFSQIRTESKFLSIYRRTRVSENPYFGIFYPVIGWRGSFNYELKK